MHEINRNDVKNLPNDSVKTIYAYEENKKINRKINKNKTLQKKIIFSNCCLLILWIITIIFLCLNQFAYAIFSALFMIPMATINAKKMFSKNDPLLGCILVLLLFAPILIFINFLKYKKLKKKNIDLESNKYYIDEQN